MSQPKYQLGDRVYRVSVQWTDKQVPCPDCFGHRRWSAILPAGEEILIECPTCWAGYEGSIGTVSDWDFYSTVTLCVVTGLACDGSSFEYQAVPLHGSYSYTVKEERLYATKEEAEKIAADEVLQVARDKRTQQAREFAHKRKDPIKGMTAYWRREMRDAKKKLERCEKALAEINSQPPQVVPA